MSIILAQKFANNEIRIRLAVKPASKTSADSHQRALMRTAAKLKRSTSAPVRGDGCFFVSDMPLDIIREFQRASPSPRKGGWGFESKPKRFTRAARHKILEAGAILDKKFGRNALFLTGTLPGSTPEAIYGISLYSGYIINRMNQWLRRICGEMWNLYVWEWQKRGALHMHMVVASASNTALWTIKKKFKSQWIKVLKDVSKASGFDLFESAKTQSSWVDEMAIQADSQWIAKSACAYLTKYCSKSNSKTVSGKDSHPFPARWAGMSRLLSNDVFSSRDAVASSEVPHSQGFQLFYRADYVCRNAALQAIPMKDKYHPDNVTYIFYFPPELLTETWENVKALFNRNSCNLEAHINMNSGKDSGVAYREIMKDWYMKKCFIAEMMDTHYGSLALPCVLQGDGGLPVPGIPYTCEEWVNMEAKTWLPILRRNSPNQK